MAAVLLTPPNLQFTDDNGDPVSGGFVYTYAAGTLTPKATYTDYTGVTPVSNPVELDAAGRPKTIGAIWLLAGGSYKFIVKNASLVDVGEPIDNVTAFSTASGLSVLGTMAAYTIVGNSTGSAAIPTALTVTQTRTLLGLGGALTTTLGADVALNNTGTFFLGPSVAQGIAGTWFASATITLLDTAGSAQFNAKLWDGTTVMASAATTSSSGSKLITITLSGFIANPVGDIRISVQDSISASGIMKNNISGVGYDSTLTAFRIS